MVFIHSRRIKSKQVRFRIFKFASSKLLLFVVIVLYSRNKSFPRNPYSRVSKNSSSVSKLETENWKLETGNPKLEPRNSILDSRKHRGSRIEFRVETAVNLLLPGTVYYSSFPRLDQSKILASEICLACSLCTYHRRQN